MGAGQRAANPARGPTVTKILAFSPKGRLLASGNGRAVGAVGDDRSWQALVDSDSGIDIWDAIIGKKMATLAVSPQCLAFSPQGTHLATGGLDQTVLIWPVPRRQLPKQAKEPSHLQCEGWWSALGGDAKVAYQAIGLMLEAPDQAVALLKERLRPTLLPDAGKVAKLMVLLDSAKFAERDQAQAALEKMGESIVSTIKATLAGRISLETRRRLESLLRKGEATSPTSLRQHPCRGPARMDRHAHRMRPVAHALADGAPDARLTVEARTALKRL